jgi:hypothetical protein
MAMPFGKSFEFTLFDKKGHAVEKTREGIANSQPASSPNTMKEFDSLKLQAVKTGMVTERRLFRPDEMFVLTNKGAYDLVIRRRICVPMTNGIPDLKAMEMIPGQNPHYSNQNLGVAVSDAIHVRIIKE